MRPGYLASRDFEAGLPHGDSRPDAVLPVTARSFSSDKLRTTKNFSSDKLGTTENFSSDKLGRTKNFRSDKLGTIFMDFFGPKMPIKLFFSHFFLSNVYFLVLPSLSLLKFLVVPSLLLLKFLVVLSLSLLRLLAVIGKTTSSLKSP